MPQHLTDIDQYAVTKLMPIMIIDCFEMINVTHHGCHRPLCSESALQKGRRSRFVEFAPVEQSRQFVGSRYPKEFGPR